MTWWQRVVRALGAAWGDALDAVGLGLLATAAFTWSVTAGFAAAGLAVLVWNWQQHQEGE